MTKEQWKKSFTIQDFFTGVNFWFEAVGIWTAKFDWLPNILKPFGYLLGTAYRSLIVLLMVHIEIVLFVTSVQTYRKDGLFEAFLFIFNIFIYMWCFVIFVFYGLEEKNIKKMFVVMNEGFRYRSAPGLTYVTVEPGYKRASKLLNAWNWACIVTGAGYALVPLVNGSHQLPLPTWYPFDLTADYRFEVIYLLQYAAQVYLGTIFANAMGFCFFIFVLFISQLDILCASIKNVPFTALIKAKTDKRILIKLQEELKDSHQEINQYSLGDDTEILEEFEQYDLNCDASKTYSNFVLDFDTFKDPEIVKYLKESLIDCIVHHQTIMDLTKIFQNQMNVFLLLKIGDINLLLTIILFAVTITEDTARKVIFSAYLSIPSMELLFLTYFGQILTLQSTCIINAVMNSPWHLYMVPVRKKLSIMLAEGVKPFYLTAGRLLNISISTLIAVMRASFSYYTLLAKLNRN